MIRIRRHPPYEKLSGFFDGTLDEKATGRVATHLERCDRCRREVGVIRDADAALREIPIPPMPDGIFERVLERRAAGIRTVLPAEPAAEPAAALRPRRRRRASAGSVLALAFVAVSSLLLLDRKADAVASSLEIGRVSPRAGAVPLTYRPGGLLRGEGRVTVRARVWTAAAPNAPQTLDLGSLRRSGDLFEGSVTLPADAAFALVAIEDPRGAVVDVNGGAFWEYEGSTPGEAAATGLARLSAYRELSGLGVVSASNVRAVAVLAAEAAPGDIGLWEARADYELRVATSERERAALMSRYRAKLSEFDRPGLRAGYTSDQIARLVRLAVWAGDEERRGRFLERLAELDPTHYLLADERAMRAFAEFAGDDRGLLAALERQWVEGVPPRSMVVGLAIQVAQSSGDLDALSRWGERMYATQPANRDAIAREFARTPGLRDRGIELLRERIDVYASPPADSRPLYQSRTEFEAVNARTRAALLVDLGRALYTRGDRLEALSALDVGIEQHWDPAAAVMLVRVALEEGGLTDRIRSLAARVRADRSFTGELPAGVDPGEDAVQAGREALVHELTAGVSTGDVPDARLRSRFGDDVPIEDGGVTVIALWQSPPASTSEQAAALGRAAAQLIPAGVRLLVASPEQWLARTAEVADEVGARPVVDDGGSATEGFGGWHLWEYVVVHDGWYSVHYDLEDAARLALLYADD